jgi:plastocyanin
MTTRFSPARAAIGLAAVGLLALAGCGGSSESAGTAPTGVDVEVRAINGIAWNAKSYTATATDGTVTLFAANDSSLPHNLHVLDKDGKDVAKAIDLASPGSSGTVELKVTPGEYRIVCQIPGHTNMNSTLTVS